MKQTDNEPLVCADVQEQELRKLATATLLQALHDAQNAKIELALEAAMWLCGPDIGLWLEWAGMSFADPFKLLSSGGARKAKTRQKGGNRVKKQY
jgi:hypothetical protein